MLNWNPGQVSARQAILPIISTSIVFTLVTSSGASINPHVTSILVVHGYQNQAVSLRFGRLNEPKAMSGLVPEKVTRVPL